MTEKSKKTKKNRGPFISAGGICLMALVLVVILAISLWGLYKLEIIEAPEFFAALFEEEPELLQNTPSANIAGEPFVGEIKEAIPREEYALALAKMHIPSEYYRNYKITVKSQNAENTTEYFAVKMGNDWWVQTAENNVILHTAVCKDGSVVITDNAANKSATTVGYSAETPSGVSFEERCGIMTLESLVNMIRAAASGEAVEYGGGIANYSLSYTQGGLGGENLFSFNFVCHNGVTEEYTFSFENAVILSASKTYNDAEIFKMEIKDYRNELSDIDTESLFALN